MSATTSNTKVGGVRIYRGGDRCGCCKTFVADDGTAEALGYGGVLGKNYAGLMYHEKELTVELVMAKETTL